MLRSMNCHFESVSALCRNQSFDCSIRKAVSHNELINLMHLLLDTKRLKVITPQIQIIQVTIILRVKTI